MSVDVNYSIELQSSTSNSNTASTNFLLPRGFKFQITALPEINYTMQVASLPSMSMGFAKQPTPTVDIPVIGDKLAYGRFDLQFLVNDNFSNIKPLYNWMLNISGAEVQDYMTSDWRRTLTGFTQFNGIQNKDRGIYSDGVLSILDAQNNATIQIQFNDLFPVSLETIPFDLTSNETTPLTAVCSFYYTSWQLL